VNHRSYSPPSGSPSRTLPSRQPRRPQHSSFDGAAKTTAQPAATAAARNLQAPRHGRETARNAPGAGTSRSWHLLAPRPSAACPQPAAASYPGGSASSPSDASRRRGDPGESSPLRGRPNPKPSARTAAAPAGGLTPPVALRGSTRFSPERFHALLNSLSKVLFTLSSRYLFAIGLVVVFRFRWSLPPTLGCNLKQPDSPGPPGGVRAVPTGLAPSPGHGPFRGDLRTACRLRHG